MKKIIVGMAVAVVLIGIIMPKPEPPKEKVALKAPHKISDPRVVQSFRPVQAEPARPEKEEKEESGSGIVTAQFVVTVKGQK